MKASTPLPLVVRQLPLLPSAVGRVRVRLLPVTPDWRVRLLELVAFFKAKLPVLDVAVPRVRVPKVGVAVELMFWIVLTAPDATLKLVPLKLAIPLAPVVALSMVIAEPLP